MGGKQKVAQKEVSGFDFSRYWPYALLLVILLTGFYYRYYHIQYPVIGYHNWKTAHYITEARNFNREGFFKYGFFVPMRDTTESIYEQPDGAHGDTFPTISIVVGFLFRIFGESVVVARLANILFSLGAVAAMYFLVKELFHRESLALLAASLSAINPMLVFFSHNVQMVNPGIFFMLLGAYFYIRWLNWFDGLEKKDLKGLKHKDFLMLYYAVASITLAVATKYTFAVIIIPILFTLPYKTLLSHYKGLWKFFVIPAAIASFVPLWFIYTQYYVNPYIYAVNLPTPPSPVSEFGGLIDFKMIFDAQFWATMKLYVADNFTLYGMLLFFLGSVFFSLVSIKNFKKRGYRFMLGFLISVPIFIFIMGYKLSGHNYHQFPIAPVIIFMTVFLAEFIGRNIMSLAKENWAKVLIFLIVVVLLVYLALPFTGKSYLAFMEESRNRMFDTQFPGLDIGGEYIKQHSQPDEKLFHSSGQSFGVLWHAERGGYKPPATADYFRIAEEQYNVKWIFIYNWGIQGIFGNQEVYDYIKEHYRLVQVGFVDQNGQAVPLFFLFRQDGTFNESLMNSYVEGKAINARTYYYSSRPYEVKFINIE